MIIIKPFLNLCLQFIGFHVTNKQVVAAATSALQVCLVYAVCFEGNPLYKALTVKLRSLNQIDWNPMKNKSIRHLWKVFACGRSRSKCISLNGYWWSGLNAHVITNDKFLYLIKAGIFKATPTQEQPSINAFFIVFVITVSLVSAKLSVLEELF